MGKKTFNFYQDTKVVTWNRVEFTIDAETKEQAIEKMKSLNLGNVDVCSIIDDDVDVIENDILWDTQQLLAVDDNGGCATIEIYDIDRGFANKRIIHNGL